MGRPLLSRKYAKTPAERIVDPLCQKWSATNNFDPDSDDFFADAQEERALMPGERAHIPTSAGDAVSSNDSSPSLSDLSVSGESEAGRTVVELSGEERQAVLGRVGSGQWGQHLRTSGAEASEWLIGVQSTVPVSASEAAVDALREGIEDNVITEPYQNNPPSFEPAPIRTAALLTQTRPTDTTSTQIPTPPLSPPVPHSVLSPVYTGVAGDTNRGPLPEDRAPSVRAAIALGEAPLTPWGNNVRGATQTIYTPSPPPSAPPRFYSWQSHAIPAVPTSPTRLRGVSRDGPLTNPHARRSLIRISTGQTPVLVSNTAN